MRVYSVLKQYYGDFTFYVDFGGKLTELLCLQFDPAVCQGKKQTSMFILIYEWFYRLL
jgi:hypothetical protein